MQVDRRTLLGGMAAAALAGPALARKAAAQSWYANALVIDGLGGINDPYGKDGELRLTDNTKFRDVRAIRAR